MTYSLESFVRSYSAAVQSMWEKLAGLERVTKPKRRTGFDEDAAAFHPYDTPNPYEPALDDNELVAVRRLIEERFPLQTVEGDCTCPSWGNPNWPHRHGCPADPAPTIASAAPQCAVDGEGPAADSGIPQPPAAGRYVSIHDLRQAADLIGSVLTRPDDPRDYDYIALAERLSAAADQLEAAKQ